MRVGQLRRQSPVGSSSCVLEELDVSGSELKAADAVALVGACGSLKTLTLGEWAMPVAELRSTRSRRPGSHG